MTKYSCERCGKEFSQKSHYDSHKRTEKPCENYSNKIPLEKGVNYVWEINHYSKGKTIEYKEVTTLAKATEWTFSNKDKNYQISISKDKKQATKIVKQENIGIIMNGWGLDPKYDTKGPIKIEIFVNDKLVKTFNYEVY